MPSEPNIRWTGNQRSRLNSAVRRYNSAIRKAIKNNPLMEKFLPSEVKYSSIKNEITSRRALNNTVNRLNRIRKENALELIRQDDGSIVTRYERREYAILRSVRERGKSMRRKKLNEAIEKNKIGSVNRAKLEPDKRPISGMSANSLRRFIQTQEREMNLSSRSKGRRYLRNYTTALYQVFGGYAEYDDKIYYIQDIIERVRNRSYETLIEAIDSAPSIDYIYDPLARDAKMERIYDYWRDYDI